MDEQSGESKKEVKSLYSSLIFISSGISDEGPRGLFYPLFYDSRQFLFRNVASQAGDNHVQCVLQITLIPYKILYSARRMPCKLTEQLVGSKEAADVARYSAYVRGRLHIPAGQRTCTPCTGHHRAATT